MSKLADKQLELFQEGLTEEEYQQVEKEFLELYYKLREKSENSWYSKLTHEKRQKLHKYILLIYSIKNRLCGYKAEVIKDEREQTNRPIIFALTHVGKFDIEVVSEAVKDHYYLLSGDFEHLHGRIDDIFLRLNGVFYFNEIVKEDRVSVTEQMIDHLNENGNVMFFIEGTWNVTPNLPMLQSYWGIIDVARKSNAIIIPIASDQYGKKFKVNVGKNFDVNNYGDGNSEKSRAITDLRDILATLKWEIWETEYVNRHDIPDDYWDKYVERRFKEWPYFNLQYIDRLIFKPKNIVESKDVYALTKKLVPSKDNAFLYNNSLKDDIFNK